MQPVEFDAIVFQEETIYVAHCPELDVSSCGQTLDQARQNLKTAVRLFLEEAEKLGTLEDILLECSFQMSQKGVWISPRLVSTEVMQVGA